MHHRLPSGDIVVKREPINSKKNKVEFEIYLTSNRGLVSNNNKKLNLIELYLRDI